MYLFPFGESGCALLAYTSLLRGLDWGRNANCGVSKHEELVFSAVFVTQAGQEPDSTLDKTPSSMLIKITSCIPS